jgi:hypothetical protein
MSGKSDDAPAGQPPQGPGSYSQELQHNQVSARVPEKVGRGVFSTGFVVLQGEHEFILDFLQGMVQPRQVAARVVVPPSFVPNFLAALRNNLAVYQNQFGPPPALRPPPDPPPTPAIDELYAQFKLPDEMLGGVYANSALIVHTQAEFCLDFVASCYPRSVVASRVYLAAPQVPLLLNTLTHAHQQYQQKFGPPGGKPPATP